MKCQTIHPIPFVCLYDFNFTSNIKLKKNTSILPVIWSWKKYFNFTCNINLKKKYFKLNCYLILRLAFFSGSLLLCGSGFLRMLWGPDGFSGLSVFRLSRLIFAKMSETDFVASVSSFDVGTPVTRLSSRVRTSFFDELSCVVVVVDILMTSHSFQVNSILTEKSLSLVKKRLCILKSLFVKKK